MPKIFNFVDRSSKNLREKEKYSKKNMTKNQLCKKIFSIVGKKDKYSDYEIAPLEQDQELFTSAMNAYDLAFKLEQQFYSSVKPSKKDYDAFDEVTFEISKQQKALRKENLPWIRYDQFDDLLYHSKSKNALNYSAKWRSADFDRKKDWKVLLKELNKSSHMTQDDLKIIAADLECTKNNSIEIFGISQNPRTLNYVIVMDYLFSRN